MRQHTVIPMSFGTVFKTRDDIVELLRGAHAAFSDVLAKMEDKLEFGLKVLWDRDVIVREIEREDEDVKRLKKEISSQKGSTYFARMQYGRLVDAALQNRSERCVADIFEQLRDVSVASRANKPIGDKMIMNAAFLVSRSREAAFDAKVKRVGSRYENMTFKYTGPWPPYNFVNIRLKLERADVIILDTLLIGGLRFVLEKLVAAVGGGDGRRHRPPRGAPRRPDAAGAGRDRRERSSRASRPTSSRRIAEVRERRRGRGARARRAAGDRRGGDVRGRRGGGREPTTPRGRAARRPRSRRRR